MNTHYVFTVDVSGSMYGSIDELRKDLKNKITTLLKPSDSFSLVYFSGKSQAGTVLERFTINGLTDLDAAKQMIDKYIRTVGLTAFAKPLEIAGTLVDSKSVNVMLFMTDGYNNDCSKEEVMTALKNVAPKFEAIYFVEYGFYCDSAFIAKMAQLSGAQVLNAKGFVDLSDIFTKFVEKDFNPKIEVTVDTASDFVFGCDKGGNVITYQVENKAVRMSPETSAIVLPEEPNITYNSGVIAAAGYLQMGNAKKVDEILLKLRDKFLLRKWENCYGKQAILEFRETLQKILTYQISSYSEGEGLMSTGTAYSVMNLLSDLSDAGAEVIIKNYSAIGRKMDTDIMTQEQRSHMATLKSKKEMDAYVESLQPLPFINLDADKPVSLRNLVFNTSRANVGMLLRYEGYVILPENKWGKTQYDSWIYRNYTVIKDGILNMPTITVNRTKQIEDILTSYGVAHRIVNDLVDIDLTSLPIVTRALVQAVSAQELAKLSFLNERLKATQKVLNFYNKQANPKTTDADPEFNEFLKAYGITYNGFAPKGALAESTDVYMAPELDIKIKGLSSLPSVDAVVKAVETGKKLTLSESLMKSALDWYNSLVKLPDYEPILKSSTDTNLKAKRQADFHIASAVSAIILSKGWFIDKTGFDDNVVILPASDDTNGFEITVTFDYKDIEVKI